MKFILSRVSISGECASPINERRQDISCRALSASFGFPFKTPPPWTFTRPPLASPNEGIYRNGPLMLGPFFFSLSSAWIWVETTKKKIIAGLNAVLLFNLYIHEYVQVLDRSRSRDTVEQGGVGRLEERELLSHTRAVT